MVIQDLNSTFGTFVNSIRVRGGSVRKCVIGDVIRFGIAPYGPRVRLEVSGSDLPPLDVLREAKSLPEPHPSVRLSFRSARADGGGGGGSGAAIHGESATVTPRGGPAVSQQPATLKQFSQSPDHHAIVDHLKGATAKLAENRRVNQEKIEASRYARDHSLPRVFAPFPDLSVDEEVEVLHLDPSSGNVVWAKGTIVTCFGRDGGADKAEAAAEGVAEEKGEDRVADLPTHSEVRRRRRLSAD